MNGLFYRRLAASISINTDNVIVLAIIEQFSLGLYAA